MSLVLTSLFVAGGILAGRFVARTIRRGQKTDDAPSPKDATARETPAAAPDPFAAFPCKLGDVVLAMGTDEAWLAGALLLSEGAPSIAIYIAPDAGGDRGVLARPRPTEELYWLSPLDGALARFTEPPPSLEHQGERFERKRRIPLSVERHGTGAPDLGTSVIYAEYMNLQGDVLVMLVGKEASRAWSGRVLSAGMYDVLESGRASLET